MGMIIALVSGKGGVGKTTLTTCLGTALSQNGHHVLITDGDLGLRDLDLVLGKENEVVFDLTDVCADPEYMDAAVISIHDRLDFLPACQSKRWEDIKRKNYRKMMRRLSKQYDYILIDAPAGIGRGSDTIIDIADRVIIVSQPFWVSLRNVGRIMQVCHEKRKFDYALVINGMSQSVCSELDINTIMSTVGAEKLATIIPYHQDIISYTQEGRLHELASEWLLTMLEPLVTFTQTGMAIDENRLTHTYDNLFTSVIDSQKVEPVNTDTMIEENSEEDTIIQINCENTASNHHTYDDSYRKNYDERESNDNPVTSSTWMHRMLSPISQLLHKQKSMKWSHLVRRR